MKKLIAAFSAALLLLAGAEAAVAHTTHTPTDIIIVHDAEGQLITSASTASWIREECRASAGRGALRLRRRFRGRRSDPDEPSNWAGSGDFAGLFIAEAKVNVAKEEHRPVWASSPLRRRHGAVYPDLEPGAVPRPQPGPRSRRAAGSSHAGRFCARSGGRRGRWGWRGGRGCRRARPPQRQASAPRPKIVAPSQTSRPNTGIKATARRIAQPTRNETKRLRGGPRTRRPSQQVVV